MIGVHTNAGKVAAEFFLSSPKLEADIVRITRNSGRRLRTAVRRNASGGVGPEIQSGEYRDSWQVKFRSNVAGSAVSIVGTDKIQGYRLEYGFNGADSLGRVYSQPPNPHVEPAVAEVGPVFVAQMEAAVRVWLSKRQT